MQNAENSYFCELLHQLTLLGPSTMMACEKQILFNVNNGFACIICISDPAFYFSSGVLCTQYRLFALSDIYFRTVVSVVNLFEVFLSAQKANWDHIFCRNILLQVLASHLFQVLISEEEQEKFKESMTILIRDSNMTSPVFGWYHFIKDY